MKTTELAQKIIRAADMFDLAGMEKHTAVMDEILQKVARMVPDQHQRRIMMDTLKMHPKMVPVMGGVGSMQEAIDILIDKFNVSPQAVMKKLRQHGQDEDDIKRWMSKHIDIDRTEFGNPKTCPLCGGTVTGGECDHCGADELWRESAVTNDVLKKVAGRKLNARQKKYLDKLMRENLNFKSGFDLTREQENILNNMNVFEDLLSHVDRYVGDKRLEEIYGK